MLKFLKTIGLALSILIGLFFLIQLIPASSIEISSKTKEPEREKEVTKKNKSTEKNILLLGRPGKNYSGGNLTDTIILVHLEPTKEKVILISLPRDLLVKIPKQKGLTKINSLYNLVGIEGLKEKIEEITDLSIDHYIIIDLAMVKEIIELVDGVNVYVPQDIDDPYFPGPNYTYQSFILKAGWRYLDGQTALKYIRTRYTSPNGDFDRMARQQQIIHLLKQKVLTLNPLWNFPTCLKIFNTFKNHIKTDLGLIEMKELYQTTKETKTDKITHLVIDKKRTDLLIGGQVILGQQTASVVYPKTGQGNYSEIREYIRKVIKAVPQM